MLVIIPMSQLNLHNSLSSVQIPFQKRTKQSLGFSKPKNKPVLNYWSKMKNICCFVGFISLYPLCIQQSLLTDTVVLLFELVWLSGWMGILLAVVTLEGGGFGEFLFYRQPLRRDSSWLQALPLGCEAQRSLQ